MGRPEQYEIEHLRPEVQNARASRHMSFDEADKLCDFTFREIFRALVGKSYISATPFLVFLYETIEFRGVHFVALAFRGPLFRFAEGRRDPDEPEETQQRKPGSRYWVKRSNQQKVETESFMGAI